MSYDYEHLAHRTRLLVSRFGRPMILRKKGTPIGPDYEPITAQETDITIVGVVVESTEKDTSQEVPTRRLVRKVLMAATATPDRKDLIVIDGVSHEIESVVTHAPGDTVLLHECRLVT